MADSLPHSDGGDDAGARPPPAAPAAYPGAPRWVKVSAIVVLILVLLAVGAMVAVGGQHGPGRHMSPGTAGGASAAGDYAPPVAGAHGA